MKKQKLFAALLAVLLAAGLTACGQTAASNELENGVSAIEDAMSTSNKTHDETTMGWLFGPHEKGTTQ